MAKKHFQADQITGKLREAEVEISKGQTIGQVVKKLGITEQTYCRWRKEYGASDFSYGYGVRTFGPGGRQGDLVALSI